MRLTIKQNRVFLFITQGIGIIFCGIFLTAYFGGLPSTETLNSDPTYVFVQSIIGAILITFIFLAIIVRFIFEK